MALGKSALYLSAATMVVASFVTSAHAQIEEIIVTAQKREQSVQDVPISMTAIGGEELLKSQVTELQDLALTLPNVHISRDTISNNIYMRGVGSGVNPGFEQAVAIFVDGAYRGRSRYSNSTLVDVERAEVLRGPQTTYFGNNAIGGAFSITTRGPDLNSWKGYVQGSYEFVGNEPVIEAAVGGPLVEGKFGIRLATRYSDLGGYVKNQGTGENNPKIKDKFVRLSTLWQINPDWSSEFKAEYGKQNSDGAFAAQLFNCPASPMFGAPAGSCAVAIAAGQEDKLDFNRVSNGGEIGRIEAKEFILNLKRANDTGLGLFAQASHSEGDFIVAGDTDLTKADRTTFSNIENSDQTTVEVRLESPKDSKIQFMLGGYYLNSKYSFQSNFNLLSLTPGLVSIIAGGIFAPVAPYAPLTVDSNIVAKENAYSFFGSVTVPFTDRLSATVGLRYINSRKSAVEDSQPKTALDRYGFNTAFITDPVASALASALVSTATQRQRAKVRDDDFLPSAVLNYKASEDLNFYAKYSDGFKAGGFDPLERSGVPGRLSYGPETVQAYEIGMKSLWFDRTFSFNIALFRSDYKDLQQAVVQVTSGAGGGAFVVTENVGGLRSQGVEVQASWAPTRNFNLSTEVAYLDAYYKDYTHAGCNAVQQISTPTGCFQDMSGIAPPFAPEFSGTFRARYDYPLSSSINFSGDVAYSFSSSYSLAPDNDPITRQRPWTKVDLRAGLSGADENWSVALIGKNIFNEKVFATANDLVGSLGSYYATIERGRSFAIQARYNWK